MIDRKKSERVAEINLPLLQHEFRWNNQRATRRSKVQRIGILPVKFQVAITPVIPKLIKGNLLG